MDVMKTRVVMCGQMCSPRRFAPLLLFVAWLINSAAGGTIAQQHFCANLTGAALDACEEIPESCVSIHAPRFIDAVGDHALFLAIRQVFAEAELGSDTFFVLGAGRGTTATHTVAKAASANRTVIHFKEGYRNRKGLGGAGGAKIKKAAGVLINGQHDLRSQYIGARQPLMRNTGALTTKAASALRSLVLESHVTGFFDSPFVHLFTELFFATCPHGVRVVLSTREALAWAKSRQKNHGKTARSTQDPSALASPPGRYPRQNLKGSTAGFVCPFALDPRLLDPFSLVQCAAFARRFQAPGSQINESQAHRLPGSAALDFGDVDTFTLATAMDKYNQYVHRLVPQDLLLDINFWNGFLLEKSSADALSDLEEKRIAEFTKPGL
jgi:hypothetical protein